MPSVEQTLAQIGAARIFSKLDANSGFWQVEFSRDSALLTTFITPFGRYCFNRLPFGITSAPEHFQRRMGDIVSGLEGVVCLVNDILVFGETQEEHGRCLTAVLARIKDAGLTLNREKCQFNRTSIKLLGQVVDGAGIRPDPDKLLMAYRTTPLENGYSPAELLMGRKVRTTVPITVKSSPVHYQHVSTKSQRATTERETADKL